MTVTRAETLELRPITDSEFDAFFDQVARGFYSGKPDEGRDIERGILETDRAIAFFDGDRMVATTAAFTRDMTVPGGPAPVACVTAVTVSPVYTRRGLLTSMMRHQLTDLHERGAEPVAALWASEPIIYGRFGYGVAAHHLRFDGATRDVRIQPPDEVPSVRVGDADEPDVRAAMTAIYERTRVDRIGSLDRRGGWWTFGLYYPESRRNGGTALRAAFHDGPDGTDGYLVYAVKAGWNDRGPHAQVTVFEFVAENPVAYRALAAHMFGLDLVRGIHWEIAPLDEPLLGMIDESHRLECRFSENIWIRTVDVDRALASRSYLRPADVVFDVDDGFCPWNNGRWRLAADENGAVCERTTALADIKLGAQELGAAYLGGTLLTSLTASGRVHEQRRGAVEAASLAFAAARPPFCPEVF